MSSTTADTSPESVGYCRPPTPPASPPPHPAPALRSRAPVRRQLDFADADAAGAGAGGGDDQDDYDDVILTAVDDIERGYNEAKRRAPPCVCGRGDCAVQRDNKRARWMYVCPSQPKCKYVAMCEEVDQNPQSPPAVRSDPKPSNPCVFSVPRTPVDDAGTRINNVNPQGAGATTPVNVSPQAAVARTPLNCTLKGVGAMTPVHVSPQGVGATTPVHVSPQGAGAATPVNVSPKAAVATTPFAGAMTPVYVSPQGAGTTEAVKVSSQWHRSNNGPPFCQCTAGKCKKMKVGNEVCYVCPIPKGQGACSFKLPVTDAVKGPQQIAHGNNAVGVGDNNANGRTTPRAVVHQKSPGTPLQPIAMARTPATSPMAPFGSGGPMTPRQNNTCRGCGKEGHPPSACPKRPCFLCGMVGHWRVNCPQPRRS